MSIKRSTYSGIRWTSLSALAGVGIQLLQIAILARFLSPEAFGLMAIALVVINFAQAFSDIGLSQAIIHYKEISVRQLSTLYWLNIIAGFSIAMLVFAVAPAIAMIYGEEELQNILPLIGLCFIFYSMGQQFKVLMQKHLFFKKIAIVEIISKLMGLLSAVVLAINGFGVYSLVYAAIITSFAGSIGNIAFGMKINKPVASMHLSEVKEILSFGVFTSGERVITLLGYNLDTLLIGKLLGMDALGLYSLAKQLIMRPAQVINPIVTRVTMPVMAKMQNNLKYLKAIYLQTTNYLASINFSVYGLMIVFSPFIVSILFGNEWIQIVPIVKILCIYGALRSVGNPVGSLIVARGKYKLGFWWNILGLILLLPTIYFGTLYGLTGVCWALVILGLLMLIPNWAILIHPLCWAKFLEYHKNLLLPLMIVFVSCGLAFVVNIYLDNMILGFIVGTSVASLSLIVLNWFFNKKLVITFLSMFGLNRVKT